MSNANLTIKLDARTDTEGRTYYIGRLKTPVKLDAERGLVFLIFTADPGQEEIQIAGYDTKRNNKEFE
jgi:hypothetical protein